MTVHKAIRENDLPFGPWETNGQDPASLSTLSVYIIHLTRSNIVRSGSKLSLLLAAWIGGCQGRPGPTVRRSEAARPDRQAAVRPRDRRQSTASQAAARPLDHGQPTTCWSPPHFGTNAGCGTRARSASGVAGLRPGGSRRSFASRRPARARSQPPACGPGRGLGSRPEGQPPPAVGSTTKAKGRPGSPGAPRTTRRLGRPTWPARPRSPRSGPAPQERSASRASRPAPSRS